MQLCTVELIQGEQDKTRGWRCTCVIMLLRFCTQGAVSNILVWWCCYGFAVAHKWSHKSAPLRKEEGKEDLWWSVVSVVSRHYNMCVRRKLWKGGIRTGTIIIKGGALAAEARRFWKDEPGKWLLFGLHHLSLGPIDAAPLYWFLSSLKGALFTTFT